MTVEAISRAQSSLSAKRTLHDFIALHDMSFLAIPGPAVHAPSLKRKSLISCVYLSSTTIHADKKRKKRKEEIDNKLDDEHPDA